MEQNKGIRKKLMREPIASNAVCRSEESAFKQHRIGPRKICLNRKIVNEYENESDEKRERKSK